MKTLKKTLCLVLAVVMVVGVLILPASATDYADDAEIEHKEAVEVLTGLGIINGTSNGFEPNGTLTRAAGARIASWLAQTPEGAADYVSSTAAFPDVPSGYWGMNDIAYCANYGIIGGDSDGEFNPEGTLTGVEFAKMLLVVLGYDPVENGFVGKGWNTNIEKVARKIELNHDLKAFDFGAPITRDDAVQMAYNALFYSSNPTTTGQYYIQPTADLGEKDRKTLTDAVGSLFFESRLEAILSMTALDLKKESGSDPFVLGADYNIKAQSIQEDSLAGDTFHISRDTTNGSDAMGRPATVYTLADGSEIVFPKSTAAGTVVYDGSYPSALALAKSVNGRVAAISGTVVNGGTDADTTLKIGDVVEVFVTNTSALLIVTRYSAGTLTGDPATKGSGNSMQVRLPGVTGLTAYVAASKVDGYETLAKGDVTYFYQDNTGVYHLAKAGSFVGQLSTVTNGVYVISNTAYQINENVTGTITGLSTPDFKNEYTFYTDANGFIIASKAGEVEQAVDYVVLQKVAYVAGTGGINGTNGYVEARLVKMDGSTVVAKINSIKLDQTTYKDVVTSDAGEYLYYLDGSGSSSKFNAAIATSETEGAIINNTFFTYSVKDGAYDLTKVETKEVKGDNSNGATITKGGANITLDTDNKIAIDGKTVFVVANKADGSDNKYNVYVGNDNVPTIVLDKNADDKLFYLADNGIATYVYVPKWKTNTTATTGDQVFLLDTDVIDFVQTANSAYGTFAAIVNGDHYEEVKLAYEYVDGNSGDKYAGKTLSELKLAIYTPTYTGGVITGLDEVSDQTSAGKEGYNLSGTTLVAPYATAQQGYACASTATVFLVDADLNVVKTTAAELTVDKNDEIHVVENPAGTVSYLVIFENDDGDATLILKQVAAGNDGSTASSDNKVTALYDRPLASATTITLTNSDQKAKLKVEAAGVGATVQWKGGSQSDFKDLTSSETDAIEVSSSADVVVTFRVTTVDGGITDYTVTLHVPAQ